MYIGKIKIIHEVEGIPQTEKIVYITEGQSIPIGKINQTNENILKEVPIEFRVSKMYPNSIRSVYCSDYNLDLNEFNVDKVRINRKLSEFEPLKFKINKEYMFSFNNYCWKVIVIEIKLANQQT